ncbi:pyruvate flavodoxin/ferredoxin oxidoreductase domain-containing protein [Candidatus Magnetoovum chiemensis]|nr:pyruvate flavodoxin/ferredoxin oxidoreductase domain-containing protein [Candidatus Magnetoovum chiemensis]
MGTRKIADYTIRIGGEAGQGLQTIGDLLSSIFVRSGLYVFTHQDYMSRIRGGHNFYQIRFSECEIMSSRDSVDILVALDSNTIEVHKDDLAYTGVVVYDGDYIKTDYHSLQFLNVPFERLAVESGASKIMANSVAVGGILGMLAMELDLFDIVIAETLKKKGAEIIEQNKAAALIGFEYAGRECLLCSFTVPKQSSERLMLINGNDAIGLGALMSGCKFYSAYPMTPSTSIMIYLASKAKEYSLIVEQAEDEISAINMALGASFAGVRSMTGTSGGGFALMVEGVSLAAMTETPLVIAEVQRPGPATGFPTRTEQGDLMFILHSGHGEFPRVVFAPGTPKQALYLTNKAFELAEKYQIQVFIISDHYLADSQWTFTGFEKEKLIYNDYRLREETSSTYKRYAYTDTGVTPLSVPELTKNLVVFDSDEHDEEGHIVEDRQTRIKMVEKRLLKKLPLIRKEIAPPLFYGEDEPDIVVVGWGSTYGVIKDAVDVLLANNKIGMLHFSELYPFPETDKFNYIDLLEKAKLTICVENNATGQFASLMRMETGYVFNKRINKYDGRLFTLDGLIGEIDGCIRGL